MAKRTVYSCDVCGAEVSRQALLRAFTCAFYHDPEKGSGGAQDPFYVECCDDCGRSLRTAVRERVEALREAARTASRLDHLPHDEVWGTNG